MFEPTETVLFGWRVVHAVFVIEALPVQFMVGAVDAVSYTHLDVYKRQLLTSPMDSALK